MSLRRAKQIMFAMTAFALLLGFAHFRAIRAAPQFKVPVVDEAAYDEYATGVLNGSWPKGKVFYQDPLYPYFLAAVYKIAGHKTEIVKIIQILLGAALIPLIFGTARRAFGAGVGAMATVLAALYVPLYFFEGLLVKETLSLFLLSASLWSLLKAADDKREYKFVFPGILLGLACLTRANLLLMIPVWGVWIFFSRRRKSGWKPGLTAGAVFVAGSFAAISPVAIHNVRGGDFALVTAQGGQNLYIGVHAGNYTGTYSAPPFVRANPIFEESDFRAEAEKISGRKMKPSEISRFWYGKSWEAIREAPKHFLWLLWRKTELAVNNYEISDDVNYYFFKERYSWVLRLPTPGWGFMSALAIWGMLAFVARGKNSGADSPENAFFLMSLIIVYSATLTVFYVFARYRLPMLAATAPFAAFGLKALFKERRIKYVLIGFAVVASLLFWTHRTIMEPQFDMARYQTGNCYAKLGKYREAEAEYREAILLNPQIAPYHVNLAAVLYRTGRYKEASVEYLDALNLDPKNSIAHFGLGDVFYQLKRFEDAVVHYQLGILYGKGDPDAWVKLGRSYLAIEMKVDAAACLKKALEMDPKNAEALKAMEEIGHPD